MVPYGEGGDVLRSVAVERYAEPPGTSIYRVAINAAPHIILTYDDGPEPGHTERVLEALDANKATATFFVLLSRVRRYRSLFTEVVAAGHEIGLHGVDHRRLTTLDPLEVERRMVEGKAELENALSSRLRWFRPPYGRQSELTWRATVTAGLTPVLWSIAIDDWLDNPFQAYVDAAAEATPGSILLLHDGYATIDDGADDGPAPQLKRGDLSRHILDRYKGMGLKGCSLGEAARSGTLMKRIWLDSQRTTEGEESEDGKWK